MLIRNVGHLMTNPAILTENNEEIPEGLMDAMFTTLIGAINFNKNTFKNSIYNSIYVVKPKMHGPEEVAFANETFNQVEQILNLPKLGCLNIHPSLLLKYRGRFSTLRSILNGDKETGITIFQLNEKYKMVYPCLYQY